MFLVLRGTTTVFSFPVVLQSSQGRSRTFPPPWAPKPCSTHLLELAVEPVRPQFLREVLFLPPQSVCSLLFSPPPAPAARVRPAHTRARRTRESQCLPCSPSWETVEAPASTTLPAAPSQTPLVGLMMPPLILSGIRSWFGFFLNLTRFGGSQMDFLHLLK